MEDCFFPKSYHYYYYCYITNILRYILYNKSFAFASITAVSQLKLKGKKSPLHQTLYICFYEVYLKTCV